MELAMVMERGYGVVLEEHEQGRIRKYFARKSIRHIMAAKALLIGIESLIAWGKVDVEGPGVHYDYY